LAKTAKLNWTENQTSMNTHGKFNYECWFLQLR